MLNVPQVRLRFSGQTQAARYNFQTDTQVQAVGGLPDDMIARFFEIAGRQLVRFIVFTD